jgi:hypothetical protein
VAEGSYEIRVSGKIPADELVEFESLRAVVRPAGTVLRGVVADQAGLQALLKRLYGLGLDLTEVRRIGEVPAVTSARPR